MMKYCFADHHLKKQPHLEFESNQETPNWQLWFWGTLSVVNVSFILGVDINAQYVLACMGATKFDGSYYQGVSFLNGFNRPLARTFKMGREGGAGMSSAPGMGASEGVFFSGK